MRRFLLAVAALVVVTASPAYAGYIIIRVLLEGGGAPATGGGGLGTPGGLPYGPTPGGRPGMGGGSMMGPPPGTGGGKFGGSAMGPPLSGVGGVGGMPPSGGGYAAEIDHSRAVVIVVPLETDFLRGKLDPVRPPNEYTNPEYRKLLANYYGRQLKSSLFIDSSTIQLYEDLIAQPGVKKTRGTEMRERYAAWAGKKTDTQALYDALILALESGIIRETAVGRDGLPLPDATKIAQELLDAEKDKKPLPEPAQRFVKAWAEVAQAVRMPAPPHGAAEEWKSRLDATNVRTDGHYALVSWDSPDADVVRRGKQLNDNFTAFYLWHATRGVALPVPARPFVAVLARPASTADQRPPFFKLQAALDGLSAQTDAFYSPEHDLLVFAPELTDSVGRTFQRQNHQYFSKGFSRDRLLDGQIPKIDALGKDGAKPEDVARASTLAFVEKFVVEDAELAAVSREATRQLMFATGVLPRHVTLPNWLSQGAVNVYTRPRGPAYVTKGDDDKPYMAVAFTTGYGVPNYVLHRYFRDLDAKKELNADRVKLLENVLTDAYFTGIKDALDPDPAPPVRKKAPTVAKLPLGGSPPAGGPTGGPAGNPSGALGGAAGGTDEDIPGRRPGTGMAPPPGFGGSKFGQPGGGVGGITANVTGDDEDPKLLQRRKRERLAIKSDATAWALYYYLSRARPDELKQYIAELDKLPRDLPIDGKTSYAAFVRAFKLSTAADGAPDPALMAKFAKEWFDYISTVSVLSYDIPLVVPEPPKGSAGGAGTPDDPDRPNYGGGIQKPPGGK